MSSLLSVRLDSELERKVNRLARKRGQPRSEVVREALARLCESEGNDQRRDRPYEAIAHLIGCAHGGPSDLSVRSGERVRRILAARQGKRR